MKTALSFIAQTVLFFLVFLAGTLWDPFHLKWFVTHPTLTSTRYFVPDGLASSCSPACRITRRC